MTLARAVTSTSVGGTHKISVMAQYKKLKKTLSAWTPIHNATLSDSVSPYLERCLLTLPSKVLVPLRVTVCYKNCADSRTVLVVHIRI